jgi:hypothetical protein
VDSLQGLVQSTQKLTVVIDPAGGLCSMMLF